MPDPNSFLNPIDFQAEAERIQEEFLAREAKNIQRAQVLPPRENTDLITDATNILFGDFGKTMGFTLDQKGLRWNLETAKDAWTEHPVKSAIEVGLNLAPVAFKAMQLTRAAKIAGVSDEAIMSMNLVDEGVDLASLGEKEKNIMKGQVYNLQRKRDLTDKINSGLATPKEKAFHWLDQKFGNSYMEAVDPTVSHEYMKNWVTRFKGAVTDNDTFKALVRTAPPDEEGVRIAQYFADPSKLDAIPKKYQPWAMQMSDELRTTQSQMVKEGLISAEEAEKVGPTYFSMLREGTPEAEIGAYTKIISTDPSGKSSMISLPKTYSPNLLQRSMKKEEVQDFLIRREAAQLIEKGDPKAAVSILGDKYSDIKGLINEGKGFDAVKALTVDGKVDLTPKSLTINSMAKQKALLETYRYVRDLSIKYGKKGEELTPAMKADWLSLDGLQGSDRIRRMVGYSKGLDKPTDELGFIPKNLFKEIESVVGTDQGSGSVLDILDLATSWHKTVVTSMNPGTHASNMIGNAIFMWNAGVDITSKNYWEVQSKTWDAVRKMQDGFRAKGSLADLGDLGSITNISGKEIKLADELNSSELKELIDQSTLLSSEGIGLIKRMQDSAKEGSFTKMVAKGMNKIASMGPGPFKMEKAADLYMAEDAAMKMAYYMTLRQKGLSRQSAMLEVGKRMPMYNTVGEVWKGLRRSVQPWITFPVETARILKNNLMDYPLRTSLLLQFPHFAQLGSYGGMQAMGRGQTYQTINDRKNQLPMWATKPSTVMTPWVDVNGDFRHATLDFLPYTAVFPESVHKDAPFMQKVPVFQEMMPILSGLYYAATGKDAWGREIPANSVTQKAGYAAVQTMGFLAPPIVNKYMLNANDPTAFYRFHQDLGQYPNQYTGKEGDPMFDMFLNSVVGLKNYPSSPEQAIANKSFKNRDIDAYKARMSKEASSLLKIGDTEGAGERLENIYQLILEQHGEPTVARRKFNDFLKRFTKANRTAKVLQGMSMEQLERELDQQGDSIAYESALVRDEYINTIKQARAQKKRTSEDGMFNPIIPDMPSLKNF